MTGVTPPRALNERAQRRPIRRLWMPLATGLVVGAAVLVLWTLPGENLGDDVRNFYTVAACLLGLLAFSAWVALFSGLAPLARGAYLVLLAGALLSLRVDFTGDMRPGFSIRWLDTRHSELKKHRAAQGKPRPLAALPTPAETDVPAFRGIHRDGVIPGADLNRDWKSHPPRELWRQPIGGGYAAIVGAGPLLVTIEQRKAREAVVCYDADTGLERWAYEYTADFQEALGGPGPRATPSIDGDRVYSLGATGHLACLDLRTGKPLWTREILEGNANLAWGMCGSPLILGDLVIVNPGAQNAAAKGKAVLALDKKSGDVRWAGGDTQAGYSSPQLATLAGREQILVFDGQGLGSYDPLSGSRLWWHPYPTYQGINVAQPIVLDGDRVFISAGYGVGGAMLQIARTGDQWEARPLWANTRLKCKFASPVMHQGYIYGLDDGILACLDAKDGTQKWKGGRYGHGQILLARDLIFVQCEDGHIALLQATPERFAELARLKVFSNPKNWNTPLLMDGRAYLRNHEEMAAYDLRHAAAPAAAGP
jgi:outer membrane protein assembly factor BamB